MQFSNSNGMGGYSNMSQMQPHMNMSRMQQMGGMGPGMQMMGNIQRPMNMMGPMSSGNMNSMSNMNNMPIRAGGPSINMRMPIDPHSRMFSGQGRPAPYPNPQMYMAQKRHQAPAMYNNNMQGMGGMGPNSGQYMQRGPFPGPQGYPMGHPHNMGGGPGPGFSGMPPGMRHGGMMPNNMPMGGSMNSQGYPASSHSGGSGLAPGLRPAGPGPASAPFPPAGPGGGPGMFPAGGRVKTEVPSVSPRGGAGSFQHSPVPGNPTPPLTPNQNCISAPFASPVSDRGAGGSPGTSTQVSNTIPLVYHAGLLLSCILLNQGCNLMCAGHQTKLHPCQRRAEVDLPCSRRNSSSAFPARTQLGGF